VAGGVVERHEHEGDHLTQGAGCGVRARVRASVRAGLRVRVRVSVSVRGQGQGGQGMRPTVVMRREKPNATPSSELAAQERAEGCWWAGAAGSSHTA
jgi:hypothetical protein